MFPHLATLSRGGFTILRFAGTQPAEGALAGVGAELGEGALLYVHTEQTRVLCRTCFERGEAGHAHETEPRQVVTGKLVFPDARDPAEIGRALDRALEAEDALRVYVPDLWARLGDAARADDERRRADLLRDAPEA